MNNTELTLFLFAFRYAVHRIGTQSLSAIQSELVTNLHRFPDWMLAQMERDLEWNFEIMEMHRDRDGKVEFDDDCEFQRPILEAIKQEREARK
jgi:urease accessory protein UreF